MWLVSTVVGPQALGLPAIIAVFAAIALASTLTNVGAIGLLTIVVGVIVLLLVIGIAISVGDERPRRRP